MNRSPILIVFGGLPGVGKTAIARELARQTGAVYLRIDSMEQALRDSGTMPGPMNDAGYRAAHAVAGDNLRFGPSGNRRLRQSSSAYERSLAESRTAIRSRGFRSRSHLL